MRRAVAVLAILVGAGLIAIPLAWSMFDRTADAERILDRFEFLTLGDNPARYLAEAETTREGSSELVEEALPALAAEAGADESRFPALVRAKEEVPAAREFSVRYSEQLDAVDEKFDSVYDIPVSALPLTATPWLFVLAGLACIGAGVAALLSPRRAAVVAILVLGLALIAVPVVLGAQAKAADGEDVKDFASRGLTARAAGAAQDASAALDALVRETDERTLPVLAAELGVPAEELRVSLGRSFPAAGRLLADWDVIGPRLARLADAVSASVEEFESARRLPIALAVWLLLGAGLVLSVAAAVSVPRSRTPQPR
jgi:hypothetical protein